MKLASIIMGLSRYEPATVQWLWALRLATDINSTNNKNNCFFIDICFTV